MGELVWNQFKHSRRRWLFSSRPFYSKIGTLLGVDARGPIGSSRVLMDLPDSLGQHRVFLVSLRGRALAPCVVSTPADTEDSAHRADWKFSLMRIYEPEDFGGTSPFSRANQAVSQEFLRIASISRSCFNSRSFLRNSRSSSCSSVDRPSALFPSSRSACLIQFRWLSPLVRTRRPDPRAFVRFGPARRSGS